MSLEMRTDVGGASKERWHKQLVGRLLIRECARAVLLMYCRKLSWRLV